MTWRNFGFSSIAGSTSAIVEFSGSSTCKCRSFKLREREKKTFSGSDYPVCTEGTSVFLFLQDVPIIFDGSCQHFLQAPSDLVGWTDLDFFVCWKSVSTVQKYTLSVYKKIREIYLSCFIIQKQFISIIWFITPERKNHQMASLNIIIYFNSSQMTFTCHLVLCCTIL